MSEAHITSIEALATFRNALIIFLEKADRALNEVSDQVGRMRSWTQFDQPNHWLMECRRRKRALGQAEAELFSARLSQWSDNEAHLKIAVKRHRAALEEAENKLRRSKRWAIDFDQRVSPLVKKVETLRVILEQDMPRALAFLDNATELMHRYTESSGPGEGPAERAEPSTSPEEQTMP